MWFCSIITFGIYLSSSPNFLLNFYLVIVFVTSENSSFRTMCLWSHLTLSDLNDGPFCIFYSITEKAIVMMREAAPSQSIIFFSFGLVLFSSKQNKKLLIDVKHICSHSVKSFSILIKIRKSFSSLIKAPSLK